MINTSFATPRVKVDSRRVGKYIDLVQIFACVDRNKAQ